MGGFPAEVQRIILKGEAPLVIVLVPVCPQRFEGYGVDLSKLDRDASMQEVVRPAVPGGFKDFAEHGRIFDTGMLPTPLSTAWKSRKRSPSISNGQDPHQVPQHQRTQ